MQLKVFCCSCFFVVMLKVKHFSPDLITNAVKRDLKLCFKVSSIQSQCNFEMERLIFIKFGYDVAFISYKCFAFCILFLKDDLIERLRVRCYRFAKLSNNSCIQSFKNIISTIKISTIKISLMDVYQIVVITCMKCSIYF